MMIHTFKSIEDIADHAADLVINMARTAIHMHGYCAIALSGGSTPKKLYEVLRSHPHVEHVDWSRVHFFMGDERYVAHDDDRSNQKLAEDNLLSQLPGIDRTTVHVVHTHMPIDQAASEYEQRVRQVVTERSDDGVPMFDIVVLGLGTDGHTASLFPGKPAINEREKLVTFSDHGVLPPPVQRVTFTFPLINAARNVLFLAAGSDKKSIFATVQSQLEHDISPETLPAAMVRPAGVTHWLVDQSMTQ